MPEISRFFGISVKIYYADHNPPHFHADYGEFEIIININNLSIIAGSFPPRALGLSLEWALLLKSELIDA